MIQDASGLDYNNDHDDDNAALLKPTIDHVQLQITEDDLARLGSDGQWANDNVVLALLVCNRPHWLAMDSHLPRSQRSGRARSQQHAAHVAAQPHRPARP